MELSIGAGARTQSSGFAQPHRYGTVFWEEKQLPIPSTEVKLAFKTALNRCLISIFQMNSHTLKLWPKSLLKMNNRKRPCHWVYHRLADHTHARTHTHTHTHTLDQRMLHRGFQAALCKLVYSLASLEGHSEDGDSETPVFNQHSSASVCNIQQTLCKVLRSERLCLSQAHRHTCMYPYLCTFGNYWSRRVI